jgi:hypothetical protein
VGATPQELKQEIDLTRADLAANVDALATKVTPSPAAKKASGLAAAGALALAIVLRVRKHRRNP